MVEVEVSVSGLLLIRLLLRLIFLFVDIVILLEKLSVRVCVLLFGVIFLFIVRLLLKSFRLLVDSWLFKLLVLIFIVLLDNL